MTEGRLLNATCSASGIRGSPRIRHASGFERPLCPLRVSRRITDALRWCLPKMPLAYNIKFLAAYALRNDCSAACNARISMTLAKRSYRERSP